MMLRQLKLAFLISFEYLKRKILWVLGIAALAGILTGIQLQFNLIHAPRVVKIGIAGTYQEHDLPIEVTRLLSEGVTKSSEEGKVIPNLTDGWDVNKDATQYKFKLKEGLFWADRTPIIAEELEFNIPNTTVSYPEKGIIQFNLKESYSPFPSLLVKPVFKKGSLTGIGPYKIKQIEKSRIFITRITLSPNDPNLPGVVIRFYPSEKVAVTGFNLGEVQALLGIINPGVFSASPMIGIKKETDYSKIVTILFQTEDSLLANRSIRQALSYQIPRIPGEEVANNPYYPKSWAYNKESKKYLDNPEEAKGALKRAKSNVPEDKLASEILLTTTPNLEDSGKLIADAWKGLGFDVKLRVESGIAQNFQALLITQSIPIDPDQYFLWHATQTKTNLTKYNSKRADKDLEDGRKIISEEERRTAYFDFQKTLLEDAPAVFLYFPKYNIVYLKKAESMLNQVLDIR